jgi:pimeloyl-ACP methyl ester carboxylesterase
VLPFDAEPRVATDISRRSFLEAAAMSIAAVQLGNAGTALADAPTDIRPFQVHFPDEALADLRRRVAAIRWPDKETVADQTQGVQLATISALAEYWSTKHDWRKVEARLNALPMFITEIDGLDIHFIHVKSKHENALPLIVTHGWPGSVIEQLKIIDPLTNPEANGGTASDAFHLVIPSLPGYGFSAKPTVTGWDTPRIAKAWDALMKRLGYTQYLAAGGDWGAAVTQIMGAQAPQGLLGIHTNMPGTLPPEVSKALAINAPAPAGLAPDEQKAFDELKDFYGHHVGYAGEMANRPQTLVALADSPIGLASWILDHDGASLALISRAFAGQKEGLSRDDVLDNITLYWLTNTGVSSARLYWENKLPFFDIYGVTVPAAISVFPDELYEAPRSWTEKAYPKLLRYNRLPVGGHFAAWEQPKLYVDEIRAGFKSLRK